MVPNLKVMVVAAIFKSRLKKMPLQEKLKYLCNQLEVASKIKHAVTTLVYTFYGVKISKFLKKWRLKASSAPLKHQVLKCCLSPIIV